MIRRRKDEFRLTVSHFKILQTVKELNEMDRYPTAKGVNNILSGAIDEETRKYSELTTYGTLISFPGRKLCSYILNMTRRNYLGYVYDETSDDMYLKILDKGEAELFKFNKRHKTEFKRKTAHKRAEIVKIKK